MKLSRTWAFAVVLATGGMFPAGKAQAEAPKIFFVGSESIFSPADKVSDGKRKYDSDELHELLKSDPKAYEYLKTSDHYGNCFLATYISGVALLIGGIFVSVDHPGPALAMDLGALGMLFWSLHYAKVSHSYFLKGINHYNGVDDSQLSRGQYDESVSIGFAPQMGGAKLVAGLRF